MINVLAAEVVRRSAPWTNRIGALRHIGFSGNPLMRWDEAPAALYYNIYKKVRTPSDGPFLDRLLIGEYGSSNVYSQLIPILGAPTESTPNGPSPQPCSARTRK